VRLGDEQHGGKQAACLSSLGGMSRTADAEDILHRRRDLLHPLLACSACTVKEIDNIIIYGTGNSAVVENREMCLTIRRSY